MNSHATLSVRDVMQRNVVTISPNASLAKLHTTLLKAKVGGLPVVDSGRIIGIACRSDIVRCLKNERDQAMKRIGLPAEFHLTIDDALDLGDVIGERLEQLRVQNVMQKDVQTVSPNDSIQHAAQIMKRYHVHRLPVVEGTDLVGIIASHDIVQLVADGRFSARPNAADMS